MRKLFRTCFSCLLLTVSSFAQEVGAVVFHLGDAPLIGPCGTKKVLMEKVAVSKVDIYEAVRQAGHGRKVADRLIEAILLGQVVERWLPANTKLATMGWKGNSRAGIFGVHTLYSLTMGRAVDCWEVRVTVDQKVIIFVLPKACGNLARLGVTTRVTIRTELPPPPCYIPPPPVLTWASGANERLPDKGRSENRGATVSSGELRFYPKPGDTTVCVSGVSNAAATAKSESVSTTGPININNQNINNNQSQALVPVNVVVGDNSTGSAAASGTQNASGSQSNP